MLTPPERLGGVSKSQDNKTRTPNRTPPFMETPIWGCLGGSGLDEPRLPVSSLSGGVSTGNLAKHLIFGNSQKRTEQGLSKHSPQLLWACFCGGEGGEGVWLGVVLMSTIC